MRQFISVDTTTTIPALGNAQCLAQSQAFPISKSRRRFLFVSAEITSLSFFPVLALPAGAFYTICPFIAVAFLDPSGAVLDLVYLYAEGIISLGKIPVSDPAGAGFKWSPQNPESAEFFTSGRGGYPAGTISMALFAGITVNNSDGALAHDVTLHLRAILEEVGE